MNPVIVFSGQIASGKSTISTAVATALGCERISFGGYVRRVAADRGLNAGSTQVLQELGQHLVERDSLGLCRAVLGQAAWKLGALLVIDGLRHVEIANELRKQVAPARLVLVHLSVDSKTRQRRFEGRMRKGLRPTGDSLLELDKHLTEVQVPNVLARMADLVLDGRTPESDLVKRVVDYVKTRGIDPRH